MEARGDEMTQQYIVMGLVILAVLFLLREVIGWVVRGGKSANCPGCGQCGKPRKRQHIP